jgi:hypothetical protein
MSRRMPEWIRDPERRWVLILAVIVMAITSIPIVYAYVRTPHGGRFGGAVFNPSDQAVYLSWMDQAREGRLLIENRYTTDPQHPRFFHLYFYVLGLIAWITHLPLTVVYHLARFVFGVWFLLLAHRFSRLFFEEAQTRKIAMLLLAVSSGLGWVVWWSFWRGGMASPVDVWQPEANTFFSLSANGLYPVSLCLMLGTFFLSLRGGAKQRPRDLIRQHPQL